MEQLKIKINDIARFDAIIEHSLPECGDLEVITKDAGTESGRGIVMVTFTVRLPDGAWGRAQAVTSMRLFRGMATSIAAIYNDDGCRVNMLDPLDDGVIT